MIDLFDVQTGFGGGRPGERTPATAEDWLAEMKRLSISKALVRTVPADLDRDVPGSNERLFAACAEHEGLVPCPVLLPAGGGDVPAEEDQVDTLIRRGSGAADLRPNTDLWSLAAWASGKLFGALAERRVPVLCDEGAFGVEAVAEVAERYQAIPFVIIHAGYQSQRKLLPLMETFDNVHLSIGNRFTLHGGIEQTVARLGPERLLFGSGFPDADVMPAITMLMYAEIDDDAKQLVGAGNLERLIGGIAR